MTNNEAKELGLPDLSICERHGVRHANRCSACSCAMRRMPGALRTVRKCSRCGGLGGQGSVAELAAFVRLDLPMTGEESQRYFDFLVLSPVDEHRVHGWFNESSKRVTQVG
jgi:hypothetical protein